MTPNEISGQIVDAAINVHRELGPGLLESTYQACLIYELLSRKLQVQTELPLPVQYRDVRLEIGYRIDLLVDETVIVEVKAVTKLLPIHEAQLLSYLKLSHKKLGLLINFNEIKVIDGIKRLVNNL
ncbi:MAG: GxxExxY protein [Planctomycetaceae bacterium]